MTLLPQADSYVESLRNDLPTVNDEERIRRRLLAAGLGVSSMVTAQASAAATASLGKVGLMSAVSLRFATLPLIGQLGLVTATTALIATGPVVVATTLRAKPAVHQAIVQSPRATAVFAAPGSPEQAANTTEAVRPAADIETTETVQEVAVAPKLGASTVNALPTNSGRPRRDEADDVNVSSLADETKMIDEALSLIRQKKFEQSAALLQTHAKRFPKGHLTLERRRAEQKLLDAKRQNLP